MRILVSGATAVVRQLAAHYSDHLGVLLVIRYFWKSQK